jgi:molecular chaperone DnaK
VAFDIDANGIVNVQARDKGTGKEQKITITASSGLSKEEVDRMMRDAEAHAADDKQRREEVDTRNQSDQAVYAAEKFLKDAGEKLDAADRLAIESAVGDVKKALESNDASAIKRTLQALNTAQQKAAENLYKNVGTPGGPGASGPAGASGAAGGQGDVIDAEVVEEKK